MTGCRVRRPSTEGARVPAIRGIYNTAFCYLPFVLEGVGSTQDAYACAKAALRSAESWDEVHNDLRYLFRFICEKYDETSPNCQCHHFELGAEALDALGFGLSHAWAPARLWSSKKRRWSEPVDDRIIRVDQVGCFAFATSINVLVLKLHFETSDPYQVAEGLFHLKNVRNSSLIPLAETPGEELVPAQRRGRSLLDLAHEILGTLDLAAEPHFFFYANEGRERANVFVHAEVDEERLGAVDENHLLYYLANCYKRDFDYDPERKLPLRSYWSLPTTLWGCSAEALACLTLPARAGQGKGFLVSVFKRNITNEYQFLYLLLLHQKYAYYRLLMGIGAGQRRDRAQLEQFHRELEVFRANFVFARVSETQQYQVLYETVRRELRLEEMDHDVAEPIAALVQLRQEDDDRAEREGERRVEFAMNMVACLAGVSAIVDALDIINNYLAGVLPQAARSVLSLVVSLALLAVTTRAARDLMGPRGE